MIKTFTTFYEKKAVHNRLLIFFANCYYKHMVKKEVNLLTIQAHHRVVFIGGGALPMSAILLKQKTGADITVVDCDLDAMEKGSAFVKKQGLALNFIHAHGEDLNPGVYDVIIVAKQVNAQHCVLYNIINQAKPQTKILMRYKPKNCSQLKSDNLVYDQSRWLYVV